MRRSGCFAVVGLMLVPWSIPTGVGAETVQPAAEVEAESEAESEVDDPSREEATDEATDEATEESAAEADASAASRRPGGPVDSHPCLAPLYFDDDELPRVIEVAEAAPSIAVPLDAPVADHERACVWTDDAALPFYPAPTEPCIDGFWGCRTVALEPLEVGDHEITIRIGDASPVRYAVVRVPSDCTLRPPPALAQTDEDEGDAPAGAVLQASGRSFRLSLRDPIKVDESTRACWWFPPPGVEGSVTHQWPVEPCEGENPNATTCVEVTPGERLAPGRYGGAVYVGASSAHHVTLWVPPRAWVFWLVIGVGFLAWAFTSIWLRGQVLASRLQRWRDQLERRLGASDDDHVLLLARVRSALAFVDTTLSRLRPLTAINDLTPVEKHLLEAEQLLTLSERKSRIWKRADNQLYPPTLVAHVLSELMLFDEAVLLRNYPLPATSGEEMFDAFPSLTRAEHLLDEAALRFSADLTVALTLAVREVDPDATPALAEPDAEVDELIDSGVACEMASLHRVRQTLSESDVDDVPPAMLLEIDLRLDVLRKLRSLQVDERAREHLQTAALHDALARWQRMDLQDGSCHPEHRRLHTCMMRELVWRPENIQLAKRMRELAAAQHEVLERTKDDPEARARAIARGEVPLTVGRAAKVTWRTYSPQALSLQLNDQFRDLAESFPWRRRIHVNWHALEGPLQVLGDPELSEGTTQAIAAGPRTVGFARKLGQYVVAPVVTVPAVSEVGMHEAESITIPVAPLVIDVLKGSREVENMRIQVYNRARMLVSLAGSIAAAAVLFDQWRTQPPPHMYWQALLVPVGVDLTTITVPAALEALRRLLPRSRTADRELSPDDN